MGRLALACWARAWVRCDGLGTLVDGAWDGRAWGRVWPYWATGQLAGSRPGPRPPGPTAPQVTYCVPSPLHLSELCPPSLKNYFCLGRLPGPVQDRQALVCALPVLPPTISHINPRLTPLIPPVQTNFRTPVYACPFFSPSLVPTTHDPRYT